MGDLFPLPPHFSREANRLSAAGISTWSALADLDEASLRTLGRSGGASEARLLRLRGQARLVVDLALAPQDAALLLHAGIASAAALAQADPHRLQQQVMRLQRQLIGPAAPRLDLATLRSWMRRAEQHRAGRPSN